MLLTEILPRAASLHADKEAVICGATHLTYLEVADRVARLAAALRELGITQGDRIALLHRNCHRVLEAYFAAVHVGAILVPLNHRLTARDLAFILDDTKSRLLIADDGWTELTEWALDLVEVPCRLIRSIVEPDSAQTGDSLDYEELIGHTGTSPLETPAAAGHDPVTIYYTSGTTGHQKGVPLTHCNHASHAMSTIEELGLCESDVWAHVAPMFHLADAWATWAMTWVGARHVMVGTFEARGVLRVLSENGITVTNLVPTMLNDLVHHPDATQLAYPSLRLIMSGGAPISPHLVRRIVDTFHCEYVQTYGLTETSPYLTFSLLDDELRALPATEQMRYRSMTGRAALGVELKVVDETGTEVAVDGRTVGEIVARGDRITPGYWKLPEATAEAFEDGWFHTGDLATIDHKGFLNIVDRLKDVILTGGELVYSTEVENTLAEHPAVLETAVIGQPDDRLGEAVHAVIVLKPGDEATAEQLITHCREQLAHYKCPRSVNFVEALPRTGSGKIAKKELR